MTTTYKCTIDNLMEHFNLSYEQAANTLYNSVQIARNVIGQFDNKSVRKMKVFNYSNLEEEKAQCKIAAAIGPYEATFNNGSEYVGCYTDLMTIEVFYFTSCCFFILLKYCYFSNLKIGIDLVWR